MEREREGDRERESVSGGRQTASPEAELKEAQVASPTHHRFGLDVRDGKRFGSLVPRLDSNSKRGRPVRSSPSWANLRNNRYT